MKRGSFFFLAFLFIASSAWAQARKPSTIAELAVYRGADREALLYAGAKTEGKIIWYTSLAGDSYKELVKAFETKYPGVKSNPIVPPEPNWSCACRKKAKHAATSRTPSRRPKEA